MLDGVFVIGTGRSGTHFLARTLAGYENSWDPNQGHENWPVLSSIAKAAIDGKDWPGRASQYYSDTFASKHAGHVLLDQHHSNIFFVPELIAAHANIVFLYPYRPAVQIVASMLRHKGVLSWYKYAQRPRLFRQVPYPNPFLGVAAKSEIKDEPMHMLCARRVIAHHRKFADLQQQYPEQVRKIAYEALVHDPAAELDRVFTDAEKQALGDFNEVEKPNPKSLSKFNDVLDEAQVTEINALEAAELSGIDALKA